MSKPLVQFSILAMIFFGTWFLLSRIDFITFFKVEELTRDNEQKLGALILDTVKKGHPELESDSVRDCVENIKQRLCAANGIEDSSITIHILRMEDVNAFALPGRHIIVYTGLLSYCNSPEELSGVLAHEIGHIENRDVMKKLLNEVGLSMLMTIAGGGSGREITREVVKLLSSTAFDREQEARADLYAVRMMAKADIDPEHLANFLFRLSQEKNNIPKYLEWLSTHPNSQDRSSEILKLRKQETFHPKPLASGDRWAAVEKIVRSANNATHQQPE
jgi:predicted Zn-dependent protease